MNIKSPHCIFPKIKEYSRNTEIPFGFDRHLNLGNQEMGHFCLIRICGKTRRIYLHE